MSKMRVGNSRFTRIVFPKVVTSSNFDVEKGEEAPQLGDCFDSAGKLLEGGGGGSFNIRFFLTGIFQIFKLLVSLTQKLSSRKIKYQFRSELLIIT